MLELRFTLPAALCLIILTTATLAEDSPQTPTPAEDSSSGTISCPASFEDYCANGGLCMILANNDTSCRCSSGWKGERCDTAILVPPETIVDLKSTTVAAIAVGAVFLLIIGGLIFFVIFRTMRVKNRRQHNGRRSRAASKGDAEDGQLTAALNQPDMDSSAEINLEKINHLNGINGNSIHANGVKNGSKY